MVVVITMVVRLLETRLASGEERSRARDDHSERQSLHPDRRLAPLLQNQSTILRYWHALSLTTPWRRHVARPPLSRSLPDSGAAGGGLASSCWSSLACSARLLSVCSACAVSVMRQMQIEGHVPKFGRHVISARVSTLGVPTGTRSLRQSISDSQASRFRTRYDIIHFGNEIMPMISDWVSEIILFMISL